MLLIHGKEACDDNGIIVILLYLREERRSYNWLSRLLLYLVISINLVAFLLEYVTNSHR